MKISVVITAHNSVATLASTIDSVLEQSVKADEIIVVDDGSSDATREVVKVYDGVSLLRQTHMGLFSACNNGVMMSEHGYIAFLEADTLWPKNYLKIQKQALKSRPAQKVSLVHDGVEVTLAEALKQGRIKRSEAVISKKLYETLGGFDEAFEVHEEDEFWMRVLEALD